MFKSLALFILYLYKASWFNVFNYPLIKEHSEEKEHKGEDGGQILRKSMPTVNDGKR
jgi:hypothetical protein